MYIMNDLDLVPYLNRQVKETGRENQYCTCPLSSVSLY